MLNANKYYAWVAEMFKQHIGKHVIEIGAGTGSFSRHLLQPQTKTLTLVEPSADMYPHLNENVKNLQKTTPTTRIYTHNAILKKATTKLKQKPDTIVYVNVMEHIKDDDQEIKLAYDLLQPGGRLLIFVPALKGLLGSFDKQVGHYRRYRKYDLAAKCQSSGFEITKSHYVDFLGIAPWWLSFKLLQRKTLNPHVVQLYDRICVPIISGLEDIVKPPIGKNLVLIAKKPE